MNLVPDLLEIPSLEVSPCYPLDLDKITSTMISVMVNNQGIGLAANQINLPYRIFVMQINGKEYRCINPRLVDVSQETNIMLEGCLSFPGLEIPVKRNNFILAEWFDCEWNLNRKLLDGIEARCFQHELDHLNGITILEKINGTTR